MKDVAERARAYAALGDPSRLAIVDLLAGSDRAPSELGAELGLPTNLMAHHLQILEQAGLISRRRSEGDGRRSYVRRTPACNQLVGGVRHLPRPARVAFVCSQNSARSQLAESYWRTISDIPVVSAGTEPAARVHPIAIRVGRHHGLDLAAAQPKLVGDVLAGDELVIAVCDRAYEELDAPVHWSIPDPARSSAPDAFEAAYSDLIGRVELLAAQLTEDPS
ncbi:protein-tyrosine-phosphatase [Propionicimonas paludicola]|uniref:Protein-tyrosine-phosphatase n=1 Tax=Propionicimonas paludicola TaxID=185243 RepID=A0A2A9CTH8_9ACTN|nr:helix-turn-helix domain-containing protein [Propionicimonas paludicola]PFG17734.1 protein-tyrosine-phosphatase [Propionicimonas paludicola]